MNTNTKAVFGRRGGETRPSVTPAHGAATQAGILAPVAYVFGLTCLLFIAVAAILRILPGIEATNAESAQATQRIVEIVNQPVTHLRLSGPVAMFSPGWFHPGATKPDFNNVDIRTTQELLYANSSHVTSDLNPTEMFIGNELEFNAMTKYFYTDRTLPKKRLSDSEMVEINGLYRVVGRDGQALVTGWLKIAGLAVAALALGWVLLLQAGRILRASAG